MSNNLVIFENQEIKTIVKDEEILFDLYEVGRALGYHRWNGKRTSCSPFKSRIDKVVENAEIKPFVHGVRPYLNEEMIYDFMLEAKTDKCKSFRKWLSQEVLPSLRKNGAYAMDNMTEKQAEEFDKFGTVYKIKKLFAASNVEQLENNYKNCIEYHNKKNVPDKIRMMNNIISVLDERKESCTGSLAAAYQLIFSDLKGKIQEDIRHLNNRRNGGIKAGQTKVINHLTDKLSNYEIPIEQMHLINIYPFSVNHMYTAAGSNKYKSAAYNNWIDSFPYHELPDLEIDDTKKSRLCMTMTHLDKFDASNFHKSFLDTICKHYGINDRLVELGFVTTKDNCKSYKDGKIWFTLKNI